MANVFTSIKCAVRYDNARVISWTMDPNYTYPVDFTITVERSRAGGKWIPIVEDLTNVCAFVDTDIRNFNKYLNDFYRVVLKSASAKEAYASDSCAAGVGKAYPFSSEARNAIASVEKQIELTGRFGVLLKKKEWGRPCPKCTDFKGQNTVNEHCPVCLGTGIDGGYYDGIPLNIEAGVPEVLQQLNQLGMMQSAKLTAKCVAYPWITRGDVWCDSDTNERFYIANVTPISMYKSTPLIFQLTLTKLEITDALHSTSADNKVAADNPWNDALVKYEPTNSQPESHENSGEQQTSDDETDNINWKDELSKL